MSSHPNIQYIEQLCHASYDALKRLYRQSVILGSLTVLFSLILLFVLFEQWLYIHPEFKIGFWVVAIGAAVYTGQRIRRIFSLPDFVSFYRSVADHIDSPGVRHLLDLVHSRNELMRRPTDLTAQQRSSSEKATGEMSLHKRNRDEKERLSTGLLDAAILQNLERISGDDLKAKLFWYRNQHPIYRIRNQTLLAFAITVLFCIAGMYTLNDAFYRSGTFWITYQRPVPFEFTVTPGDTTIEQGSAFQVSVHFRGNSPERVRLALRSARESQPRVQGMSQLDNGHYKSRETELFNDAEYYIEMDGFRSELQHVRVELLPRLQDFSLTVRPPGYTGIESQEYIYPFNRINTPAGSIVEIRARMNKPLEEIQLIGEESGDTLELLPDSVLTEQLTAVADNHYHFKMRDRYNLVNSNPFRFRLSVTEDHAPFIGILSPEAQIHDFITEIVPLLYEYEDDYGFTSATLFYRLHKAFVNDPVEGEVALPVPSRTRGLADYNWDVSEMDLSARDRLEYWIEVTDNNEVNGYQTSRSPVHTIEIPSLASRFFEQEEQEENIENRFSQMNESYRRMQDGLERLREGIQTRPEDDWERSQLLDEIQHQRQEIEEQLEELKRDFDELTRDMDNKNLMSDETLERYKELQQLIEEIDDPEIMQLLKEMQEQMGRFNQQQLREQLEQIEFNEDRYRERLERTAELFKSLRLDADLDMMSQLLKDLSEWEDQLSQQDTYGNEEIQQQEQVREQIQDLTEKLQQLPERSPQRRKDQIRQMSDDMSQITEEMEQRLQENIDQMQNDRSNLDEVRRQQQDMSQDMGEMSQQLSDMQQQMQQQTISINIQALRYILNTLILLSDEQEDVTRRTTELTANSPGFIEQARRQRNINSQFGMITDSLYQVSTEISQFSNRINNRKNEIQRNMNRAVNYLIERNRSNASTEERTALGGLNEIGTMVADLLDQLTRMDNNSSAQMSIQNMMEQMQNMSQDQQELNQQIQDFINDLQGERLSQDHMDRLEQMARQQNRIREQMRELQHQSGRDGDRLMSELERLSEEMEDAINDLRGGSTDELMVERQQNILSRLLEAEESVHRRDEDEEQRLGETAEDYEPSQAAEMTMEELRREIRSAVEETHYTRFREEYRLLIERYFQLMEERLD
ncbi:MAG: DUF4175 family protein [Balneolales bacterium]